MDLVNDQVCHLLYYLSFESPHGIYTGGSHSFSCRIRKLSKREDLVSATSSTSLVHTHLQLGCPRPSLPRHSQIPTTEPDQGTGMCPYSPGIEPFIYPTVSRIEKLSFSPRVCHRPFFHYGSFPPQPQTPNLRVFIPLKPDTRPPFLSKPPDLPSSLYRLCPTRKELQYSISTFRSSRARSTRAQAIKHVYIPSLPRLSRW